MGLSMKGLAVNGLAVKTWVMAGPVSSEQT